MSEKTTNIYQALMQAQKDMGPLLKNATNPAFRSKYADLGSVIETITEPLHKNGLVFYQFIDNADGKPLLRTCIAHVNGTETLDSWCPIVSKDPQDPQKMGAAITYARRYSLMALLGLAPEDDDGHAAAQPARTATSQKAPSAAPKGKQELSGEIVACEYQDCTLTLPIEFADACEKKFGKVYCKKHWAMARDGELDDPKENIETESPVEYYGQIDREYGA